MSEVTNCNCPSASTTATAAPVEAPKPAANNPAPVAPEQKAQGVPPRNPRRQVRKQH